MRKINEITDNTKIISNTVKPSFFITSPLKAANHFKRQQHDLVNQHNN